MDIYIGQQFADGVIRYITVPFFNNPNLTSILRTFYRKEPRVSALIELGNLVTLRPTPYGKSEGYDDKVRCRAEIRDNKEKKGKHLPRYVDTVEEYAKLDGHLFLFKDNCWHFSTKDGFTKGLPDELLPMKPNNLDGLELYTLNKEGEIHRFYGNTIKTWRELFENAISEAKPYFVFRKEILIATINHPLTQK